MSNVLESIKVWQTKNIDLSIEEICKLMNENPGEYAITDVVNGEYSVTRFKKNSDADNVNKACKELRYFHDEPIDMTNESYLRGLVSTYNSKNGTAIKVSKRPDGLYLFKGFNADADVYEKGQMLKDLREALGFTHEPVAPTRKAESLLDVAEEMDDDEELAPE